MALWFSHRKTVLADGLDRGKQSVLATVCPSPHWPILIWMPVSPERWSDMLSELWVSSWETNAPSGCTSFSHVLPQHEIPGLILGGHCVLGLLDRGGADTLVSSFLAWSTVPRQLPQHQPPQNTKLFSMLLLNYLSTISWKEKFFQSLKSSLLVSRKEKETKPNMSKEKITVTPCALESGCRIFTNVFQIQNVQNCLPNDMWFQSKQFIFLLNEYLVYRNGKLCGFQLLNQPPCVQDLCWLFHSNIVYLIQTPNTKRMGIFWLLSWVS